MTAAKYAAMYLTSVVGCSTTETLGALGSSDSSTSQPAVAGTSSGAPAGTSPGADTWACDDVDFRCGAPLDCERFACGGLFARFDDRGCPRPACVTDAGCGERSLCFRASEFGLCASGGLFCSDASGACDCTVDGSCDGAYCVPESIYPAINEGPGGPGRVDDLCGPTGGDAFVLFLGLPIGGCSDAPALARVTLVVYTAPPATGRWALGSDGHGVYDPSGDGNGTLVNIGSVEVERWQTTGPTGAYTVFADGRWLRGTFDSPVPFCADGQPRCE